MQFGKYSYKYMINIKKIQKALSYEDTSEDFGKKYFKKVKLNIFS
jgi:hypothetical protein